MKKRFYSSLLRIRGVRGGRRRQEGATAVEFAILILVLLSIVAGVADLGHAWYIKQVLTNASREGARYGTAYQINTTNGTRIAPNTFPANGKQSISDYVKLNYLNNTLVGSLSPTVTVSGAGYTTGARGAVLSVTVSATKTWDFLGMLPNLFHVFDSFATPATVSATTVLQCE